MDKFTILWAHEAELWIQDMKGYSEKGGYTLDLEKRFYTPSKKIKKDLHNAIIRIHDDVVLFTNILTWFIGKGKDFPHLRIWFMDVEDRDGNGFYLDLWYNPKDSAMLYKIKIDDDDRELGRVIFDNLPSLDYNYHME